jgi:ribonuclease-3
MHSSSNVKSSEALYNNERLEFLGDAILGAIIGEYLFKKYPNRNEGFLTQLRSKIVNRKNLHQLALKFGLNNFLKTNLSKKDQLKSSAFGDAFEALIGALYLDLGYEQTKKFVINKIVKLHIDMEELLNSDSDFKSQLQIYCQKNKLELQYNFTERNDPGQGKYYFVNVVISSKTYEGFEHYSKKVAEQKAAEIALNSINGG